MSLLTFINFLHSEFGFGKNTMSELINEECQKMHEYLELFDGKDFLVNSTFNVAVVNMLFKVVSGSRFEVTVLDDAIHYFYYYVRRLRRIYLL